MTGDSVNEPQLIGLAGVSGAGKDVVASILTARSGYRRVAIADPIKEVAAVIFDLDREQLWGDFRNTCVDRIGQTPREAFQKVGDGIRSVDPCFWITTFTRRIQEEHLARHPVVCPDVRTREEFEAVRKLGGVLWLVTRPGAGAPGKAGKHSTETHLATIPRGYYAAAIVNDSNRATLIRRCEEALRFCHPS